MAAKRMKAPSKRGPLLHLSRFATSKRESNRQLKEMKAAGIREIEQMEDGRLWRLRGRGTITELAAFIVAETKREGRTK